jgi:hypothetical protein
MVDITIGPNCDNVFIIYKEIKLLKMERFKYLISRFGMIIPFVLTIICLLISKSTVEPHAGNAEIAMWVFFSIFVAWLGSWLVRVGIKWFQTKKEIDEGK